MLESVAYTQPSSPLSNGDFETSLLQAWEIKEGSATLDKVISFEGRQSVKLTGDATLGGTASVAQIVPLPQHATEWVLQARFRTMDAGAAYLAVEAIDDKQQTATAWQSDPVSLTTFEETWEPRAIAFKVPAEAVELRIRLVSEGGGIVWVDQVRLRPKIEVQAETGSSPSFVHVPFRENQGPHHYSPSNDDEQVGCVLFNRNPFSFLFPTSVPLASEQAEQLKIRGCAGQIEPLLVGFHALRGQTIETVEVRFEGVDPDRLPLPTVGVVQTVPKRHLYHRKWSMAYTDMPMLIEQPRFPIELEKGESLGIWIECKFPPLIAPASYRGSLTIRTKSGAFKKSIEATVYPFELPKVTDMFFGAYTMGWSDEASMRLQLQEMSDSGMTTIGYCAPWMEIKGTGKDFELEVTPLFKAFSEEYQRLQFGQPLHQLVDPARHYVGAQALADSPNRYELYEEVVKEIIQKSKEHALPDYFLQPIDEPSYQPDSIRTEALELNRRLKNLKQRTTQTAPPDRFLKTQIGQYADLWVINGMTPDKHYLEEAKQAGKRILIYNTDVEAIQPIVDRYTAGFFQIKYGLDGAMQWQFQDMAAQHAYNEIDPLQEHGYMAFFYPSQGKRSGGPTIAWRAFRAGIYDYRYLLCLQQRIATKRAENPELALEAEEALERIMSSLKELRKLRNVARWSEADSQGRFLSGVLSLDNGWEADDYDRYRHEIAEWIIKLQ